LIQDQESVFKLREGAQSIFRIKLPPENHFRAENLKIFDFRFNTHSDSLIQDQGSVGNARNRFPRIKLVLIETFFLNFESKNMKKSPQFRY
jgi:hypothetical protein